MIYIEDTFNNRIRRIDTKGVITTIAGNGSTSGVGQGGATRLAELSRPGITAIDSKGNFYVVESGGHRISIIENEF